MDYQTDVNTIAALSGTVSTSLVEKQKDGTSDSKDDDFLNSHPPILIFKNYAQTILDLKEITESLASNGYSGNEFEKIKHDKKGNVLIFCKKKETNELIIQDNNLFNGAKKIILDDKPSLIMKNIKIEKANEYINELNNLGIVKLEKIGKAKELNMTRAFCKNNTIVYELLMNYIKLDFGVISSLYSVINVKFLDT